MGQQNYLKLSEMNERDKKTYHTKVTSGIGEPVPFVGTRFSSIEINKGSKSALPKLLIRDKTRCRYETYPRVEYNISFGLCTVSVPFVMKDINVN